MPDNRDFRISNSTAVRSAFLADFAPVAKFYVFAGDVGTKSSSPAIPNPSVAPVVVTTKIAPKSSAGSVYVSLGYIWAIGLFFYV